MRKSNLKEKFAYSMSQETLFGTSLLIKRPPSTRYQGSKLKLLDWIWSNIEEFDFHTVLEPFGGTGCVSYMLKAQGKKVTYSDYLEFNKVIGEALIENNQDNLTNEEIEFLLQKQPDIRYDNFIEKQFVDVFFTNEENAWLDMVCQNIPYIKGKYKRAIAFYALFQSCIIKRPYNLFHRKNLYMRTSDVERNFGNKATWDTPFEEHFRNFVKEVNDCVIDTGIQCKAIQCDALKVEGVYDLVYIDTPYLNSSGVGVDYLDFYHFLEGLLNYKNWSQRINYKKKHFPLLGEKSPWSDSRRIHDAFKKLLEKFKNSLVAISYRSDGIPSENELVEMLKKVKQNVKIIYYGEYKYVLSKNGNSKEILILGF